jgi:hypothetical protein
MAATFGASFEGPLHARQSHSEVVAMVEPPGREVGLFGFPRQSLADNQKMLYYYEGLAMGLAAPDLDLP